MDKIKDKKIVGLIILLVIVILLSVITYIKNKQYIFKDEYKENKNFSFVGEKKECAGRN